MYRTYCRAFQGVMKLANYALPYGKPTELTGVGAAEKIADVLRERHAATVLVVTGKHITAQGLNRPMLDSLERAGIRPVLFTEMSGNPTDADVEHGFALYRKENCQAIIAFGGGTPMDCAKAIGAKVVHPDKSVAQLQGLLKVRRRIPLFFAVPTTAGTGSETTIAAVITDTATHRKASINDPALMPDYAVLDPTLTVALPPEITAATGMDALCHAVEAYTNHTYCTGLENDLAKKAVRLIYENLLTAYRSGTDLTARQNMLRASFYAGRAFTRGCVGYVHAVGHTLGGLYGMPHGTAMAILLPHVLRRYGDAVTSRLSELADVCGIEGATAEEKAENFITWIEEMKRQMNIPEKVDCIREEDIPQMVAWAVKEANPLYPVPAIWTKTDFADFIGSVRA